MPQLQTPVVINGPFSTDGRYLKDGYSLYTSVADVNAYTNSAYRSQGMTFLVAGSPPKEYWYLGGILDVNLVEKNPDTGGGAGGFLAADY